MINSTQLDGDEERPMIMAKAIRGIAEGEKNTVKQSTLLSLVHASLKLDAEEKKEFNEILNTSRKFKEAKMFNSVQEFGRYEGKIEGKIEGKEEKTIEILSNLLRIKFQGTPKTLLIDFLNTP